MNKTKALWMALATVAVTLGGASAARADQVLKAKVPFTFIAGDERLPSGDYVIKEQTFDGGVITIASADGRYVASAQTIPSAAENAAAQPKVVFEMFSNQHFLAGVVPEGGAERDIVLTPAIMERALAKVSLNQ